jgi:transcriptional regulator with XRE-family HTH domain
VLVKIGEKLAALLREKAQSRTWLDREAVLKKNAVSGIVGKGHEPGVSKALAIARALGVSLDWLADDDQGLPPVPAGETLGFVRLLSAEQREQLNKDVALYSRDVALAAGAALLSEPDRKAALVVLDKMHDANLHMAHPAKGKRP